MWIVVQGSSDLRPNQTEYLGDLLCASTWLCIEFLCISHQHIARHYNDVIMGAMASRITGLTIVYSTVYSGTDQRKHQSSASLAFVRGIHR